MAYEPDGDPDSLDFNNIDDVQAYLDDPGNIDMWAQLGEQFKMLPKDEQIALLREQLAVSITRRDQVAALLAGQHTDKQDIQHDLLRALSNEVERITDRIVVLMGADSW